MISAFILIYLSLYGQPVIVDTALPTRDDILSRKLSSFQRLYYLENYEKKYMNELSESLYFQLLATGYSLYGNRGKAITTFQKSDKYINKVDSVFSTYKDDYKVLRAVDVILNKSAHTQIVIINEAHHIPQTRLLTIQLLSSLKKMGFNYLAIEALRNDSINLTRVPNKNYLSYPEPIFGELLRSAIDLNYTLVSYEAKPGIGIDREKEQASQIFNKILKNNPKAKIIIHCGYSHASESMNLEKRWMASYLKENYQIDPLTVDQTFICYQGIDSYNKFIKQYSEEISYPFCLERPDNSILVIPTLADQRNIFDLQVFYPIQPQTDSKEFLKDREIKKTYFSVDRIVRNIKGPYYVSAYYLNDHPNVIPVDLISSITNSRQSLYLPTGKYIISVSNLQDSIVKVKKIKVRIKKT